VPSADVVTSHTYLLKIYKNSVMCGYRIMLTRNLRKRNAVYQQHRLYLDGLERDKKSFFPAASIIGLHAYEWLRGQISHVEYVSFC